MSKTDVFLVLLGGDLAVTERLRTAISGARVIAADNGIRHAEALGVTPEVWVGDFDSATPARQRAFGGVPRQPFPSGKNETDGELAVAAALERGASSLVLAGAHGGSRSDHALFHLLLACRLRAAGTSVMVTSGSEEAVPLLPARETFALPAGSLFSILGFSPLEGLSIEGARYPLDSFALPFGASRTISNVSQGTVTITLEAGTAVLIARPYDLSGS